MSNVFYQGKDFYLSYMDKPSDLANLLDTFAAIFGQAPPTGQDETAICTDGKFYILYGDHKEAYLKLAPQGLQACMNYFVENIELIGHSSNKLELNS